MAIYIIEANNEEAKALKTILKKQHSEILLLSSKGFLIQTKSSPLKPHSIVIYKGLIDDPLLKDAIHYCRGHQIPLLTILDKASLETNEFIMDEEAIIDVVTEPTEKELLLRVNQLLNYQKEKTERLEKERRLGSALARLTEELEFAKKIQQLVLPHELAEEDIKVRAIYEPSQHLSGDLYFWIKIAPHQYGVIIIDVSGHGVHAALVSMAMRSLFPGLLKRVKDPKKITQELNEHMLAMFESYHEHRYVTSYFTAIILTIDTTNKTIHYVNAGHQPGLYLDSRKQLQLESSMVPIGLIHKPQINEAKINYESGARLLLFTDGLVETPFSSTMNRGQELQKWFWQAKEMDEQAFLEQILQQRKKEAPITDDICAISITLF